MKRRPKKEGGGANWMDTYGDMVTLLLCFFVLLYSISSVDQSKWIMLVKSFNPEATEVSQIVTDTSAEAADDVPGGINEPEEEFGSLFAELQKIVEEAGLTDSVELFQGDGYTFVTFRDSLFFDGDSSVIRPEGQAILDRFTDALSTASDSIKEIQVLGHTSQASPTEPNNPEVDRMLSAERSARVVAYMQMRSFLSPDKLISIGYGQHRPIAPFDTSENRAKNRRVELLITKSDSVEMSLEEYYKQMDRETVSEEGAAEPAAESAEAAAEPVGEETTEPEAQP